MKRKTDTFEDFCRKLEEFGYNGYSYEGKKELFNYITSINGGVTFTKEILSDIWDDWSEYDSVEKCLNYYNNMGCKVRCLHDIDCIYIITKDGHVLI